MCCSGAGKPAGNRRQTWALYFLTKAVATDLRQRSGEGISMLKLWKHAASASGEETFAKAKFNLFIIVYIIYIHILI